MEDDFEKSVKSLLSSNRKLYNANSDEILELYALYKQASVGDVNIVRPSEYRVKDFYMWDAWNRKKGMNPIKAKEALFAKIGKKTTK